METEAEHINRKLNGSQKAGREKHDLLLNHDDEYLLGRISEFFKGYFDAEDVKNDPSYHETTELVRSYISEYRKRKPGRKAVRAFIEESLINQGSDREISQEISEIKQESNNKNIDNITAEWVKEWHERKRKEPELTEQKAEIREFVTGSPDSVKRNAENDAEPEIRKPGFRMKSIIISYTTVAAAAVIGLILLIRYFMPSADPDKMFARYYEPYYPATLVTRSAGSEANLSLRSALESYRDRNYQLAAVEFSNALIEEHTTDMPRLYLGITLIELNDLGRAVMALEPVAQRESEFTKDARWYLGLIFLKTGEKEKATEYFEFLAGNPGFYSKRSAKILRSLK
jgi:hypothetical protein